MSSVAQKYSQVLQKIEAACKRVNRSPQSVKLIAVSKKQPLNSMVELVNHCQSKKLPLIFGENYVQEFKKKRETLPSGYECHLIGPLQRNKAKDAVKIFSLIESVHSIELAQSIDREAKKEGKIQDAYLQVNISNDEAKGGFIPDQVESFFSNVAPAFSNLKFLGLMTITRLYDAPEEARPDFKLMHELRRHIIDSWSASNQAPKLELSMGMSADYEIAIEEGATAVRVGTAIFGDRG